MSVLDELLNLLYEIQQSPRTVSHYVSTLERKKIDRLNEELRTFIGSRKTFVEVKGDNQNDDK